MGLRKLFTRLFIICLGTCLCIFSGIFLLRCNGGENCAQNGCPDGKTCSVADECVCNTVTTPDAPGGSPGAACDDNSDCATGRCSPGDCVCICGPAADPGVGLANGQPCDDDRNCLSGNCDEFITCTCVAKATCPTLNVAGNWIQSFICFDVINDVCDGGDNDAFVINQNCEKVSSDVLNTADPPSMLEGTFVSASKVIWSAMEDSGPDPSDDYTENGEWLFSDADHFTSSSAFTYKDDSAQGSCQANAAREGTPLTPVACPTECCGKEVAGSSVDCCSRPECAGNPNCPP